jgi:hypothetical protein
MTNEPMTNDQLTEGEQTLHAAPFGHWELVIGHF